MTQASAQVNGVTLTKRAADRLREIAEDDPARSILRIAVEGGGCSGFKYTFDLVPAAETDDVIIEKNGARVAIDSVSVVYMLGSEIDFVDELIGATFRINNPLATAACGCGTSFSI